MTEILNINSSALTHPGRKRVNNEDYFAYFEPSDPELLKSKGRLYVVADGVGGASEGERASQYAAQKILHEYYLNPESTPSDSIKQAIRQASQDIYNYAEDGLRRMATTVVAAIILGDKMIVANVGDSRAYLIRNGEAVQITIDHNTVEEMVQNGLLSEEDALNFKAKNVLTRAVGSEFDVDVDIFSDIQLQSGDKILLCTDGLTRYADRQKIAELTARGQLDEITTGLINHANQQGGKDNTSVILIEVGKPGGIGTIVDQHSHPLPPEVDWETITTQAVPKRQRKIKRVDTKPRGITVPLLVGSFSFLVVLSFVGFVIWKLQTPPATNATETQNAFSGINALTETATYTQATSLLSTSTPEVLSTPEIATSTSLPENTMTQEIYISTEVDLIPEGEWCVYIVTADNRLTVLEIVELFAGELDPESLLNQVFEASGGLHWKVVWPNENDDLPENAPVAMAFVKTVQECEDHGGSLGPRP